MRKGLLGIDHRKDSFEESLVNLEFFGSVHECGVDASLIIIVIHISTESIQVFPGIYVPPRA